MAARSRGRSSFILHTGLLDINGAPKKGFHAFGLRMKAFR
jgi:hypothetical protein